MITKMKLIAAPLTIVAMTLLMGGGQALASFTAVNDQTGFNSENTVEASAENGLVTVSSNTEVIVNSGSGIVDTGDNSSSENTGQGNVLSGDLAAFGDFFNEVNLNATQDMGLFSGDFFAKNGTTGANSDNNAESEMENSVTSASTNDADVANDAYVQANSGGNAADENTDMGQVDSGMGWVGIAEINQVNGNSLNIGSDVENKSFSAMATNEKTGADSDNKVEAELQNTIDAENTNSADLDNSVFASIDTGSNSASENTGMAKIDTGKASAWGSILNEANKTQNTINIDPVSSSSIEVMNSTTGADSDNEAKADISNDVAVANSNEADIDNDVALSASTGCNTADENTGPVNLTTGMASTTVSVENGSFLNNNTTNIGINLGGVGLSAANNTTGADSDNDATASLDNSVAVDNTNAAEVANTVDATADTGFNSASENTGSATLATGDATNNVSLMNELNINQTTVNLTPMGDISAANSHTGADSSNEASTELTNDIAITNNNSASVENTITSSSNTGGNTVDENGGSGSVTSGGSMISFGATNIVNGNSTTVGQ